MRNYQWSTIFAWGLTLSGAALAMCGPLGGLGGSDVMPLAIAAFAGMMVFGIGLVNCSASGALHALKHRKENGRTVDWAVFLPAVAVTVGFAIASNVGVHMGWDFVKANSAGATNLPSDATINLVFYIFAFAKPATAWIVEGRKAMDAETARLAGVATGATPPPVIANDTTDLDAARDRRDARDWPPITQQRVSVAVRALEQRGTTISATAVAKQLGVGKDRICRAINKGDVRLAA